MKIQNQKLAGEAITLRYATNEHGSRLQVRGDAEGVFEVPERDAQALLKTPGWKSVRAPRTLDDAPPAAELPPTRPRIAPPAPRLTPDAPVAPPAPAAAETKAEPSDEEKAAALEAAITGLRTKADAIALGKEHGVKLDEDMKLVEMKERLIAELFEGDEEKADEPAPGGEG